MQWSNQDLYIYIYVCVNYIYGNKILFCLNLYLKYLLIAQTNYIEKRLRCPINMPTLEIILIDVRHLK